MDHTKLEQLECLRSEDTPAASWLPIPLSHIGSQVRRRQSQSYKFKKFAKISNFSILKRALHATHLLRLLDKMCKYEMDPMSIVEDTERTRFCPQTDRRTDGQGNTSIPFQLWWSGGYKKYHDYTFCRIQISRYIWIVIVFPEQIYNGGGKSYLMHYSTPTAKLPCMLKTVFSLAWGLLCAQFTWKLSFLTCWEFFSG